MLIVAHHLAGARIIEEFLCIAFKGDLYLANAQIQQLKELSDGRFRLLTLNSEAVGESLNPQPANYKQKIKLAANETRLLAGGSEWRYLDDGSKQDPVWRTESFNDSSWQLGRGKFGYGDNDEATMLSYGKNSKNKHITYYFRRPFELNEDYDMLRLRLLCDDGAIVYLNGKEIWRWNMPSDNAGHLTTALRPLTGSKEENAFHEKIIPATNTLHHGSNILAIEIHQFSKTSSDVGFDFELIGQE